MRLDYARLPRLAGKNLYRQDYATVRGAERRLDADVNSAVPYFAGIAENDTLELRITSASGVVEDVEVVFDAAEVVPAGKGFHAILANINSALGTWGLARDQGGVLSIRTNTQGSGGLVEVVGGKAAELGFDLQEGAIKSVGGEIPSAPEALVENPFGSAFPARGEDLKTESFQRALGRIASNTDVLDSDNNRPISVLKKVDTFTISSDGLYVTLPDTTRVVSGGPTGSNPGSPLYPLTYKDHLSPFFMIVDSTYRQPAASGVVGVVRGVPTGFSYQLPTASWSALDGRSVLGQDLVKQDNVEITDVSGGRIVTLGTNISADVVEGDLVEIFTPGGANQAETPWSHVGYRWILERIIDSTHAVLRPMSKEELVQVGYNPGDVQPILYLNDHRESDEVFGSLRFRTGLYSSHVNLVVDPPLDPSASYELWAAQPVSGRESECWRDSFAQIPGSVWTVSRLDTVPNCILTPPEVEIEGSAIRVHPFMARWHGRIVFSNSALITPSGTTYIYWEPASNTVKGTTTPTTKFSELELEHPALSSLPNNGIPICVATSSPLAFTSVCKLRSGHDSVIVTVGSNGSQFKTLAEAVNYVNMMGSIYSETSGFPSGAYRHVEFRVAQDVEVSSTLTISAPNVVIRGTNPGVRIKSTVASGPIFSLAGTDAVLRLEDLTVYTSGAGATLVSATASGCTIKATNVRQDLTSVGSLPLKVLVSSTTGIYANIVFTGCSFGVTGGLIWTPSSNTRIIDCTFVGVTPDASPVMFTDSRVGGAASFSNSLVLEDVYIQDLGTTNPVVLLGDFADCVNFNRCVIDTVSVPQETILANFLHTSSRVQNCIIGYSGWLPTAFTGLGNIENCTIYVTPKVLSGVEAWSVQNCEVQGVSTGLTTLVYATLVSDNHITGAAEKGIVCASVDDAGIVDSNYVSLTGSTASVGISVLGDNARVQHNTVITDGTNDSAIKIDTNSVLVLDNLIKAVKGKGIRVTNSSGVTLANNTINTSSSDFTGIHIEITATDVKSLLVHGNTVEARALSNTYGLKIVGGSATTQDIDVADNMFAAVNAVSIDNTANLKLTFKSNRMLGTNTIYGEWVGNRINGDSTVNSSSIVANNHFEGGTLALNHGSGELIFDGNLVASISVSFAGASGGKAIISNNRFKTAFSWSCTGITEMDGNEIPSGCYIASPASSIVNLMDTTTLGALSLVADGIVSSVGALIATALNATVGASGNLRMSGGRISGAVNLGIAAAASQDGSKASLDSLTITGNVAITGGANALFTLNGCTLNGNLSANNFGTRNIITNNRIRGNCSVLGDVFSGNSCGVAASDGEADLTYCKVSGCSFETTSSGHYHRFKGCDISASAVSSQNTLIESCKLSSVTFYNDVIVTGDGSTASPTAMDGCTFSTNLTVGVAGVPNKWAEVSMSDCRVSGNMLVLGEVASSYTSKMSNCDVTGTCTITQYCKVSNCRFTGTFVANNRYTETASCTFSSGTTLGVFPGISVVKVSSCTIADGMSLSVYGDLYLTNSVLGSHLVAYASGGTKCYISGTRIKGHAILGQYGDCKANGVSFEDYINVDHTSGSTVEPGLFLNSCTVAGYATLHAYTTNSLVGVNFEDAIDIDGAGGNPKLFMQGSRVGGATAVDGCNVCELSSSYLLGTTHLQGASTLSISGCVLAGSFEELDFESMFLSNSLCTELTLYSKYLVENTRATAINSRHDSISDACRISSCEFTSLTTPHTGSGISCNVSVHNSKFDYVHLDVEFSKFYADGCVGKRIQLATQVVEAIIDGCTLNADWYEDLYDTHAPIYVYRANYSDGTSDVRSSVRITNCKLTALNMSNTDKTKKMLPCISLGDSDSQFVDSLVVANNILNLSDHGYANMDIAVDKLTPAIVGRAKVSGVTIVGNHFYPPSYRGDLPIVDQLWNCFVFFYKARSVVVGSNFGTSTQRHTGMLLTGFLDTHYTKEDVGSGDNTVLYGDRDYYYGHSLNTWGYYSLSPFVVP